jgi:hypothetical protein
MKRELKKTREMKQLLEHASPETQQKLMSGFDEMEAILAQLDAEKGPHADEARIGSMPEFDRLKKTSFTMNEMIGQHFRETHGLNGITFNNMEQVYNPLVSGIGSIQK